MWNTQPCKAISVCMGWSMCLIPALLSHLDILPNLYLCNQNSWSIWLTVRWFFLKFTRNQWDLHTGLLFSSRWAVLLDGAQVRACPWEQLLEHWAEDLATPILLLSFQAADFMGIKLTTNREMPIFGLPTAAAVASCPLELQPCKQNKYLPAGCC